MCQGLKFKIQNLLGLQLKLMKKSVFVISLHFLVLYTQHSSSIFLYIEFLLQKKKAVKKQQIFGFDGFSTLEHSLSRTFLVATQHTCCILNIIS